MPLPIDFSFSQNSLQDYLDCPRRFELRYILRQKWPALPSEPVMEHEYHMELGSRLHRMIHQHITGIPVDLIESQVDDPQLIAWWRGYLASSHLPDQPLLKSSESLLTSSIAGARISARFDLVVFTQDHQALIFDWKTSIRRPSRKFLQERMQTRIYPFVISSAGRFPDGMKIDPAQVSLTYWFANFPQDPEKIQYSTSQYELDVSQIFTLVQQIRQTEPGRFILTQNEKSCSFCTYRSLCDRGVQAGNWENSTDGDEETSTFSLDFEQVAEVEF